MRCAKLTLLLASVLTINTVYAASCSSHLHIENTTNEHYIKLHEGKFSESEFIIKPGETYDHCYLWGINNLTIKSINIDEMQLLKVSTCPQHLTVQGNVNLVIKDTEDESQYRCYLSVVNLENKL